MKRMSSYQGSYLIGFIIIGAVALRDLLLYESNLLVVILLIALYSLSYSLEPWLSDHIHWYKIVYFPMQSAVVIALTSLRPFTDFSALLYVPLCIQALRVFSRRTAFFWIIVYVVLLSVTQMLGLGWQAGLVVVLMYLAVGAFLISYDSLYLRTQIDQATSQRLLADLQATHLKLREYAAQADELAAARERNRLARELHDSVNQTIFSITLTSQAARLLLEREPARVPEQIDRLQGMTEDALSRLRALITQLRPPPNA